MQRWILALLIFGVCGAALVGGTGVGPGNDALDEFVGVATSAADDIGTDAADINETAVARATHQRINEARAQRGLSPLSWSSDLYAIADDHSETMAETNTYAHEINGRDHADRYAVAGYRCDGISAENIHRTYANSDIQTERGTVDYSGNETRIGHGIALAWLNSEGHRENVLRSGFSREGIGIAVAENGSRMEVYATQNFC